MKTKYLSVGFTGAREGMTEHQKSTLAYFLRDFQKPCVFRHGDNLGADYTAHSIAQKFGFPVIIHPPTETVLRGFASNAFSVLQPKDASERNKDIVDSSDRLFAAVLGDQMEFFRSESWAMVRYAVSAEIPVTIIYPNGSYEDRFPWEG